METLQSLNRRLARLRNARHKSTQKGFVMDSYMYEDNLMDEINRMKRRH